MIGRHAWRVQLLQSLLLTAQHKDTTCLCRMLSQSELPYWILLRNGLSANFLEETAKAVELDALRIFEVLLAHPEVQKDVKSATTCSKEIKRYIRYIGDSRAHTHWWSSCTGLYTSLHRTGSTREISWKLVASSMAILTSLIATRVPCDQGRCVTRPQS